MNTSSSCQLCQLNKNLKAIEKYKEEDKQRFIKEFMKILIEYADNKSSPWIGARANELKREIFGIDDFFMKEKEHYNDLALSIEDRVIDEINKSDDPLKKAITYSVIGNYIDFDAVKDVSDDSFFELLNDEKMSKIDENVYENILKDLSKSKKLVYLLDNTGEIVFDKLLIKEITKNYPHIDITAVVRGDNIINDATLKDAEYVGLNKICRVIDNGTPYASTIFDEINEKTKEAIKSADIIISKGQGNFEGFLGSGFNTYYIFLVKCDFFVHKFKLNRFSPVFINEKDLK